MCHQCGGIYKYAPSSDLEPRAWHSELVVQQAAQQAGDMATYGSATQSNHLQLPATAHPYWLVKLHQTDLGHHITLKVHIGILASNKTTFPTTSSTARSPLLCRTTFNVVCHVARYRSECNRDWIIAHN